MPIPHLLIFIQLIIPSTNIDADNGKHQIVRSGQGFLQDRGRLYKCGDNKRPHLQVIKLATQIENLLLLNNLFP